MRGYIKLSREEIKKIIINIINSCGECDPSEIRRRVEDAVGGKIDPRELRKALADLVKEGKVRREPRYEKRKFVFTV